jgi:hypothetical protein
MENSQQQVEMEKDGVVKRCKLRVKTLEVHSVFSLQLI